MNPGNGHVLLEQHRLIGEDGEIYKKLTKKVSKYVSLYQFITVDILFANFYSSNCLDIQCPDHVWIKLSLYSLPMAHRIILHPKFSEEKRANNVALLKLKTKVKFSNKVHPICLPSKPAPLPGTVVSKIEKMRPNLSSFIFVFPS